LSVVRHLGALSLYTAVAPLAASTLLAVLGLRRSSDQSQRVFAVMALTTVLSTVTGVAVFASYASSLDYQATGVPPANPLYERNVFVVVPLLLAGLALWIERGLPRPRPLAGAIAACAVTLVLVHPWSQLPRTSNPQNLAPTIWLLMPGPNWLVALWAAAIAGIVALLWITVEPARVRTLWLSVGTWFAIVGLLAVVVFTGVSGEAARVGRGQPANWIDRAVGAHATVAVVWDERPDRAFARPDERQRIVWVNEFFNESIGTVYALGARLPFGMPDVPVRVRPDGTLVDGSERPLTAEYVLTRCRLAVEGPTVARDLGTGAVVVATNGVVRLSTSRRAC
jgi:hypothetical protein